MERPVFKPEFYRELASENPLGLTIHWREVEAWFRYIAWPSYKTYGYRAHKKATRRWWSRLTEVDLQRAHDAMDNVKIEQAFEEQTVVEPLKAPPLHVEPLRKIMGGRGGRT